MLQTNQIANEYVEANGRNRSALLENRTFEILTGDRRHFARSRSKSSFHLEAIASSKNDGFRGGRMQCQETFPDIKIPNSDDPQSLQIY